LKVGKTIVSEATSSEDASLTEMEMVSPILVFFLLAEVISILSSVEAGIACVKKFDTTSSFPVFVQVYFLPLYLNEHVSLILKLSVRVMWMESVVAISPVELISNKSFALGRAAVNTAGRAQFEVLVNYSICLTFVLAALCWDLKLKVPGLIG
jgi:hypothetical protein